jgi:HEAT repeat protein
MNKKLGLLVLLSTVFCLLPSSFVYAMGSAPPPPTQEVERAPTASEEALAKEQIDNLRNISINSKDLSEGTGIFLKDLREGRRYLYEFNATAKKELLRVARDKNEDWKYRFSAVTFTDVNNPPAAFEVLKKIIEDKSEKDVIRGEAMGAISHSKRTETDAILIRELKGDNADNAGTAAFALGQRKSKEAVQPLIETTTYWWEKLSNRVEKGERSDASIGSEDEDLLLLNSIRSLGQIGDKRAIPVLSKIIKGDHLTAAKQFSVNALGEIKDPQSVDILVSILKTNTHAEGIKVRAIEALGKIRDKRAVIPLEEILKGDNAYLKQSAKEALEDISGR